MITAKERMSNIIDLQPDDSSYEELLQELAFNRMVERGLKDSRERRIISNDEERKRIRKFGSIKKFVGKVGSLIGASEMIFRNPQSVKKNV
jgi:hypothetical protein